MVRTVIASTDPQASSGPSMPRDNVPSYLGYDLNSFGPYGLQWMLERQVDDEVFCSPQSTYQAEKALGHSVQRLDHICDHHFPTNLERFGFVRQPITQSTGGKRPKCPCSRTAERDTCPSCRPCTPVFMYTHPFLMCRNVERGSTTLQRFRNQSDNEVKIMRCFGCESQRRGACDFNNGDIRLRLAPNGSVQIVYQPPGTGPEPTVVRDIRQTNIGIREQESGSNEANRARPEVEPARIMLKIGGRTRSSLGNGKSISRKHRTGGLGHDSSDDSLTDPGDEEEDLLPRAGAPRPSSSRPIQGPYLGYDLKAFGPYGLKWMKERQAQDEVFRDLRAIHAAENILGFPLQRLDHAFDHHFPTNVERFGFVQTSSEIRKAKEPEPRNSRGPCMGNQHSSCRECRLHLPSFIYTHPSLTCHNSEAGSTLFSRFRNETENEIRIHSCHDCRIRSRKGCSFRSGDIRLRLESDGSIKIVYQNAARGPIIIRDIRETNVGIKQGNEPATTTATQDLRLQVVPQRKVAAGPRSGKGPEVHKRAGGGGNEYQSDSEESATDPEEDEIFVPTLRYQNGREILDFSNSSPEHTQKKRPSSGPTFDRVDKQRKSDQPASYNRSHNPLPTPALSIKSGSGTSQTRSLPPAPSRPSSSTSRPGEGSTSSRIPALGGSTESSSLLDLDKMLKEREARIKKILEIERLDQEIKERERRLQEEGM